jgi:hypothetical protein
MADVIIERPVYVDVPVKVPKFIEEEVKVPVGIEKMVEEQIAKAVENLTRVVTQKVEEVLKLRKLLPLK